MDTELLQRRAARSRPGIVTDFDPTDERLRPRPLTPEENKEALARARAKTWDADGTPIIGHNGAPPPPIGEGEIDPDVKIINDLFDKIGRAERNVGHWRIELGKKLIAKRVELAKTFPKTFKQGANARSGGRPITVGGVKAEAHYWWKWCETNLQRDRSEIMRNMKIAGANDPEEALEDFNEANRTRQREFVHRKTRDNNHTSSPAAPGRPTKTTGEEVARLASVGLNQTQIAKALDISPHAVRGAIERDNITPELTFPPPVLQAIRAKIMPFIEELIAIGRKPQLHIVPLDIITAAERIGEVLDHLEGRKSVFDRRKAEKLRQSK